MSQVPGQQLLRHIIVLGYFNGETKSNVLKERGMTNTSKISSTYQLLNTLDVRALLALGHGPGLSGKKPRTQNQLLKRGVHKEGTAAGPFACQQKFAGKYLLPYCQQKIEMLFFSWKGVYFAVVSVK